MTHTPGPWTYGHKGDDFWVGTDSSGQTGHVATVLWNFGELEAGRENARLIATAPDLLQTLKEIDAWIVSLWPFTEEGTEPAPVFKKAREVIAKAEGR